MKRRRFGIAAAFLAVWWMSAAAFAGAILLKEGDCGEGVRAVQRVLIRLEYMTGRPGAIFDRATADAVRRFQRDRALEADGVVGAKTWAELRRKDLKKAPEAAKETEARERAARERAAQEDERMRAAVREGRAVHVEATAYSAYDPGNGFYTASGTLLRRGVIAVDPSFIPLGTRVYIPGYGEAVAEDTGGSIWGSRIDIAFDSHEEAIEFGRRELEIYIIEYP